MDRKRYMCDYYWKYWINAREEIYGFSQYDQKLCNYICRNVKKERSKLLEVGIGTGFPFGDYFQKAGYDVYGIDISWRLLDKCKQLYPKIKCYLGNAAVLPYRNETFDCTYCFHSTWYFLDLHRAIDEMLRVTRSGGIIMFDIINKNNWIVYRDYKKRVFENQMILGKALKIVKNISKIILRWGIPEWQFVVHFSPTDPEKIYMDLNSKQTSQVRIMVSDLKDMLLLKNKCSKFKEYPRIVFIVWK